LPNHLENHLPTFEALAPRRDTQWHSR
jgi:hypothetical protein